MRNIQRAALGVSLVLLMSGCVVAPYPASDPYYVEPVVVVPPPRVEYPGPPPTVGYVWIGGNWNWYQGRHVWAPERWEPPGHRGPARMAPYGGRGWRGEQRGPGWQQRDAYRGDGRRFDSPPGRR